MKKTGVRISEAEADEMRAEYRISNGIKNPYAARYAEGTNLVLIDPELLMAFPSEKEVDAALRLLLKAGAQAVRAKTRKAS